MLGEKIPKFTPESYGYPPGIMYPPLKFFAKPKLDAYVYYPDHPALKGIEPGYGAQVLINEAEVLEGINYLSTALNNTSQGQAVSLIYLERGGKELAYHLSDRYQGTATVQGMKTYRTDGNRLVETRVDDSDFNYHALEGTHVYLVDWLMDEGRSLEATDNRILQKTLTYGISCQMNGDLVLVNKVGGKNNYVNPNARAIAYDIDHRNWAAGLGGDTEDDACRLLPCIVTKIPLPLVLS